MEINEYQQLAARTINERLDLIEKTQHALHGMAAEVGEVHGLYQKIYQGHDLREEDLKKELGGPDVVYRGVLHGDGLGAGGNSPDEHREAQEAVSGGI